VAQMGCCTNSRTIAAEEGVNLCVVGVYLYCHQSILLGPLELASSEEVDVDVVDRLLSMDSLIDAEAIAIGDVLLSCNLGHCTHQLSQCNSVIFGGAAELADGEILWQEEPMDGGLRIDVFDHKDIIVFVDLGALHLSANHLGEDGLLGVLLISFLRNTFLDTHFGILSKRGLLLLWKWKWSMK